MLPLLVINTFVKRLPYVGSQLPKSVFEYCESHCFTTDYEKLNLKLPAISELHRILTIYVENNRIGENSNDINFN